MGFFNDVNPKTVGEASDGFREFKIGDNYAYIKSVQEKISKESMNPMLEITFTDEDGAEIKYYIVDGEWKLSKLKQLYAAFGIPLGETDTNKWIGKWGVVVCKAGEPYNGKTYNKVSYVKPDIPSGGTAQGKPTAGQTARQGQPPDDYFSDDIPF